MGISAGMLGIAVLYYIVVFWGGLYCVAWGKCAGFTSNACFAFWTALLCVSTTIIVVVLREMHEAYTIGTAAIFAGLAGAITLLLNAKYSRNVRK